MTPLLESSRMQSKCYVVMLIMPYVANSERPCLIYKMRPLSNLPADNFLQPMHFARPILSIRPSVCSYKSEHCKNNKKWAYGYCG